MPMFDSPTTKTTAGHSLPMSEVGQEAYHRQPSETLVIDKDMRAALDLVPALPQPSVAVVSIGNRWEPGCRLAVQEMINHGKRTGLSVHLREIMDSCVIPYDNIGEMRCEASMYAVDGGYDWLMMIENDIQPPQDLIGRLLAHDRPLVAPLLTYDEEKVRAADPMVKANTGLQKARWQAYSCVLIDTRVFNAVGENVWGSGRGSGEGFVFARMRRKGHSLFIDTDTPCPVTKPPGIPLRSTWGEYWGRLESLWKGKR